MSINHLSFNQYVSHLTCSTNFGFIIYTLNPTLQKKIYEDSKGGVGVMKILKKSNIYVLSGSNVVSDSFSSNEINTSKNIAILWDQHDGKASIKIDCSEQIRNLLIHHKEKIVIILKDKILVFTFNGKVLETKKTYNNPNGICEITNNDNSEIIVTLGKRKGEIIVWNLENNNDMDQKSIQAHDNNIECLAVSKDGTKVATSSELGTLIRVFDISTGNKLYEFRRGTSTSKINALAFSFNNKYLACCSSRNGTVHIFDMSDSGKNIKSRLEGLKDYLPTWVASEWSFKQHYLGTYSRCICDFDDKDILHVASYDGKYFKISGVNYDNISTSDLFIDTKKN